MANLSKALNTDMAGLAQILRKKGRGKDTVLAHITPQEAALLKKRGGRGSINPDTGLPEFDDTYQPAEGYVARPETFNPEQYNQTITQQDYAQTPANAYTDASLYPGNVPPASTDVATVYGAQAPYYTPAQQPVVRAGMEYTPYTGDAMGGPASVGPATAFGAAGQPVDVASAYQLTPDQAGVEQVPTASKTSPNLFQTAYDKVSNYSPSDKTSDMLTRMGLTTALGLYGASNNRAAAASNRAATAETQAIAAPYQQQGQNLIQQAQSGTLSPASQQAYAAAQAQLAQGKSGRGGVGTQQTANQMATLYQTLLDNQYKYGLQVAQIGDNIAIGAIQKGLAMDQSLNTSTQNFYTNLASIVAGVPAYRQVAPTPTTPTGG
jgi:hypothetical protein